MKRSLSDLLPDVETREFKIENIDLLLLKRAKVKLEKSLIIQKFKN